MTINDIILTLATLGYDVHGDEANNTATIDPEQGEWLPNVRVDNGKVVLEATTAEDDVLPDIRPHGGREIHTEQDLIDALTYFQQITGTAL